MSTSLLDAFALVPDPRSSHGRFHPLVAVLALATVAVMAGCNSLSAVAQFGRDRGSALAFPLGFRRGKTPNKSCFGKIFRRLDPAAFETALRVWLVSRRADGEFVALDGKTLRGTKRGGLPGKHVLSVFIAEQAAVLGQLRVADSTDEHKAALQLLGVLPLAGRVITPGSFLRSGGLFPPTSSAFGSRKSRPHRPSARNAVASSTERSNRPVR